MTMHKALHPRDVIDRLYVTRNEGRTGLTSIENNVDDLKTAYKRVEEQTTIIKKQLSSRFK